MWTAIQTAGCRLVLLIDLNRNPDYFLAVAVRVISGQQHECPVLYRLVDGSVKVSLY